MKYMKIFAENEHEKQLLSGLCRLLEEIGIPAEGHSLDSVIAPVFWTAEDLDIFSFPAWDGFSEKEEFLHSIEKPLHFAMTSAGYEAILRELIRANR